MEAAGSLRIRRENSQPASEKQRAYAQDLLDAMVTRGLETGIDPDDGFQYPHYRYFQLAKLPDDLTSWEASNLIDALKGSNPRSVFELARRAVRFRSRGKRLFLGTEQGILALEEATQYIVTLEREE